MRESGATESLIREKELSGTAGVDYVLSSIRLLSVVIHYRKNGNDRVETVDDAFIASSEPFYLGLAVRPSAGLWEFLKSGGNPVIESDGKASEYRAEFSIDVGENTLFLMSAVSD